MITKHGVVIKTVKNNIFKIESLWKKVCGTYTNWLCGKSEKTEAAFTKAYKNYKKAGGLRTILSGEALLKNIES